MENRSLYEVRTTKDATPGDVGLLERAFVRIALGEQGVLRGVEVSIPDGHLLVRMELAGPVRTAARNGERLFASAWYDAFGEHGTTHVGRLVDPPATRRSEPRPQRPPGRVR